MVAVGFGEGAVDGDGVAAAFDGLFAFFDFDGDVAVDDEYVFATAEELADLADEVGVVDFIEVGVLVFFFGVFVVDEDGFEGGDFVLTE